MPQRYFEDFEPGQIFRGATRFRLDRQAVTDFATRYDPQPFHLDDEAAKATIFGGLAASGWQTAAITMRLLVDSDLKVAGGLVGAGMEELRWPRPVRPGDELRIEAEVLSVRESKSRPHQGIIRVRNTTLNQNGEPVQICVSTLIVPRRSAGAVKAAAMESGMAS